MKNIITGKNIVKIFGKGGDKVTALNGVDVEIAKGEFVSVMGASGSGKSTLLFVLSGTDDITEGSVKFKDVELTVQNENKLADYRRTKIGFVFQQPTVLKNLNLMDNIILPAFFKNGENTEAITKRAKSLMSKAGISGLENRDTTEVSGGQLQRACICRALINNPEIIFADEPTGSLNSKSADEIMDLLSEIHKNGTAIMLVTHDAKVAARADRVLFMKDGNIVSDLMLSKTNGLEMEIRTEKIVAQMMTLGI